MTEIQMQTEKLLVERCIEGHYETKDPYDSRCDEPGPCVLCPKFVHVIDEV